MSSKSGGKFISTCRNPLHHAWSLDHDNEDNLCNILRWPRQNEIFYFEKASNSSIHQIKGRRIKFCENCYNHLYELYPVLGSDLDKDYEHNYILNNARKRQRVNEEQDDNDSNLKEKHCFTLEEVIQDSFFEQLSDFHLEKIAKCVGRIIYHRLTKNKNDQLYRDKNMLINMDPEKYIGNYDSVLRSLIQGFVDSKCTESTIKTHAVQGLLLKFLYLKYPNVILPLSFMQNLLVYTQTNSMEAVNLLGSSGPSGKYDTLRTWLQCQTSEPLQFPEGDCVVVFDNNQIIGRSWSVKVNNKTKSNTVTTICQIEYPGYNNIQYQSCFREKFWVKNLRDIEINVREIPENVCKLHYDSLYTAIAKSLQDVLLEHTVKDSQISDTVDDMVLSLAKQNDSRKCMKCGEMNPRQKRNCASCKYSLKQAELEAAQHDVYGTFQHCHRENQDKQHKEVRLSVIHDNDTDTATVKTYSCSPHDQHSSGSWYQHITSGHRPDPPTLSVSDPCFVNPNSYESIRLVLRQIGLTAGIEIYGRGKRKWLFVVCDGLPFGLCKIIIEETLRCLTCTKSEESYHGLGTLKKHHDTCHPGATIQTLKEFDWVILRPGNGHVEMNMFKSFMGINWEVFMCDLAKIMGFCSENAQRAAEKCTDNHKTWTLIETAYEGNMKELLVPYVRKCLGEGSDATPQGFINPLLGRE